MMTRWQKIQAFIRKPSKIELLEERSQNKHLVAAAAKESARIKEWMIILVEEANKKGSQETIKALCSCALRGMTVTEVVEFNRSRIPQEIQK